MSRKTDLDIAAWVKTTYDDPLRFVKGAFPWGDAGLLALEPGPDAWQEQALMEIGASVKANGFDGLNAVDPIRRSFSSGHGVGKSTLVGWLVMWIMSTRPHAHGTVTANTVAQLRDKTWASIRKWHSLCLTKGWFAVNTERMYHRSFPETWTCASQSCIEQNSEAFAGQHAKDSTSFYIFDEACHDDCTEVLSERGWIPFRDVHQGDRLLTMDPGTRVAEYVAPSHVHVSPYDGPMLTYEVRGTSFSVTPNHRMFGRYSRPKTHDYGPEMCLPADQVKSNFRIPRTFVWPAEDVRSFTVPAFASSRKTHPSREVDFDVWAEFLGWYSSEGHLAKRVNVSGLTEYVAVGITNRDLRRVAALVRSMGFTASEYGSAGRMANQLMIFDRALAEYLAQFGVGCIEKRVPDCVRHSSARQINLFLDAVVAGDGYQRGKRDIIYTSSSRLAGDYQELIVKGGAQAFVASRRLVGRVANMGTHLAVSAHDGFVVQRSSAATQIHIRPKHFQRVSYRGMVYCASLPKHNLLFTRRDGKCMWSGNSAIPDTIYDVAEGGLTDGEPMILLFGNPTRTAGKFHQNTFGSMRHRWSPVIIDSRDSRLTNKKEIAQWIADYGENSDFVRVRVRGLPPTASDLQFIPSNIVFAAQSRPVHTFGDEPLVCGLDVARGGADDCTFRFRQGADARTIPPIRVPGSELRDSMRLVTLAADILGRPFGPNRTKVSTMFIDGTGIGGPIVDRLKQLGHENVVEVQFGGEPPITIPGDEVQGNKVANMRAFMWARMRAWLQGHGVIDDDPQLEQDLTGPGYHHDKSDRLVLESKEQMKARGISSPDDGDALGLTFAVQVRLKKKKPVPHAQSGSGGMDPATAATAWMGSWFFALLVLGYGIC